MTASLARPASAGRTVQPSPHRDLFVDCASRIAARLVGLAEWEGDACTWTVMAPERGTASRVAVPTRAGGTLYEGASGIALFLAELAGVTGDEDAARTAVGALRFACASLDELPAGSSGFHAGRTGVAFAAARAAEVLGRPELRQWAVDAVAPLEGHEVQDRGMDVIGGAAGAIPALLAMRGALGDERVMPLVRRMGDHLVASAVREPEGWSWSTMPNASARNLNGLAHGAAGFGHALLELAAATGDGRYLHGAEQAFAYERRTFNPELGNWPDLRHTEVSEYLSTGRTEELRQILRSEGMPPYEPRHMSAWCHGAPGIGLTRIRAWELLGQPLYRDEARGAVRATVESLADDRMNCSLCHGRAGNAETLLLAGEVLGDADARSVAERVMLHGCERYELGGRRWPCGTLAGVADPGLLLGEAGIGHFLLRLAEPSVPSILLVTPDSPPIDCAAVEAARRDARAADVEVWFPRTAAAFRALGAGDVTAAGADDGDPARSPVAAAAEAVERIVAGEGDAERAALLADASRAELERVRLHRSVEDAAREFLEALIRVPDPEVAWGEVLASLSDRARVVHSAHDWDAWIQAGAPAPGPEEDDVFHLLRFTGGSTNERRLSAFAAVVLEAVGEPASVQDVVERVAAAVGGDRPVDREWLRGRVLEQLRQAYRAGFVDQRPAAAPVPA
jgi:hypothetical protein